MESISIRSKTREELIEITSDVLKIIRKTNIDNGICVIFTPHTTAGITINENADPDVKNDIITGLDILNFEDAHFNHSEGNSSSHIKSSLIGCSETLIISKGAPILGTWQGIYFCEFDGPRDRKIHVKVIEG